MSVEVFIKVSIDNATPALMAKAAAIAPHAVATKIAPPLAQHWRDSLAALPRNKKGYPSTGFWEEAARRVVGIALDDGALLSCDKLGIRQRLKGGPIRAVNAANLAIPIAAESYGTTPREWGDSLTLVILGDGRKFLCLWLGEEGSTLNTLASSLKIGAKAKKAGVSARRAHMFGELTGKLKRPKVIVFRNSTSSGRDIARTEKHTDLRFLFKLQPEVADQAANPDVIPADMGVRAMQEVLKAVETSK